MGRSKEKNVIWVKADCYLIANYFEKSLQARSATPVTTELLLEPYEAVSTYQMWLLQIVLNFRR